MVKITGVEMDNNGTLTEQLKTAIKRRDVATVERILKKVNRSKRSSKKSRSPGNKQQLLLSFAKMICKKKEKT